MKRRRPGLAKSVATEAEVLEKRLARLKREREEPRRCLDCGAPATPLAVPLPIEWSIVVSPCGRLDECCPTCLKARKQEKAS